MKETISLTVEKTDLEKIDKIAKLDHRSRSNLITHASLSYGKHKFGDNGSSKQIPEASSAPIPSI